MEILEKDYGDTKQEFQLQKKELEARRAEVENQEKRVKELVEKLDNSEKQASDLRKVIAENVGKENEERQKDLKEIAKGLEIGEQEMEGKPVEEIKDLVKEKVRKIWEDRDKIREELPELINEKGEISDDKLKELKELDENKEKVVEKINELGNKVQQAEDFGLTNWNNLEEQTKGENLGSLLGRPERSELEKAERERDRRPDISRQVWENTQRELEAAVLAEQEEHQATKDKLKTWTDKFGESAEDTEVELNDAKTQLAQELNGHQETKDKLRDWTARFGGDANAAETKLKDAEAQRDIVSAALKDWQDKMGTTEPDEAKAKIENLEEEVQNANAVGFEAEAQRDTAVGERDAYKADLDKWVDKFKTDDSNMAKAEHDKVVDDLVKEKSDHDDTRKELTQSNGEKTTVKAELETWTKTFTDDATTTKDRLDQAEKDRDSYLNQLTEERDKLAKFIDPEDLERKAKEAGWEYRQEDLDQAIRNAKDKYNGWINPNDEKSRQENRLRTENEVNTKLDEIAQQLGLDNHNNLTNDNLTNLQGAEKERNYVRNSLRTNDLNSLPQIPEDETLQTLLDRPTKQQQNEAVNNARQQEAARYNGYIDPNDKDKLKEAAEEAGFGFEQKDIDEAVKKEKKQWEGFIDPTNLKDEAERRIGLKYRQEDLDKAAKDTEEKYKGWVDSANYRKDWINPKELEAEAIRRGMHSAKEYNELLQERDARPNISFDTWNDYKNRPTLEQYNSRPDTTIENYNQLLNNRKPDDYEAIKDELDEWKNGVGGKDLKQVQSDLNKLPELEGRPTQQKLNQAVEQENRKYDGYIAPDRLEKAAEERGMVSKEKHEGVVKERDARPNITKKEWEDDYNKRPTPEQLTQAVQKEKDKYSNHISPEKLTTDYLAKDKLEEEAKKRGMVSKEDYDKIVGERDARPDIAKQAWENDYSRRPKQTDLDEIKKIIQDYENGLKIGLGLDNNTLSNWRNKIDNLKNRPTPDSLNQVKNDLEVLQNHLEEWTDKFPGQSADKVLKELNELKSKPADATLINEKQQKINELIEIIKKQNRAIKKYGDELDDYQPDIKDEWKAEIVDVSKLI